MFCVHKMHASFLYKLVKNLKLVIIYIGNEENSLSTFMFTPLIISSACTCTVPYDDQKVSQL